MSTNWENLRQPGWRKNAVLVGSAMVALKAILLFVAIPYLHEVFPLAYRAESFADWYDRIAMNLVEGNGYRVYPDTSETMLRMPGWVLVLAGIFSIFGPSLTATKAFNLLFSVASAGLAYVLGRRITNSHRLGLLVAAITLLHPAMLLADSRGGLESLLVLSIMAFMLLLYRALEAGGTRRFLLAGVALGVVLLVKPSVGLFPAFLFFYMLGRKLSFARLRHATLSVGALVLVAGAVLSPWIVRNYAISGQFVPTMTMGGLAAFQGLYVATHLSKGREHHVLLNEAAAQQEAIAKEMGIKFKRGFYPQFYDVSEEIRYYDHLGDIVKKRYMEQPALLLDVIGFNAIAFWIQGRTEKATILNTILVLPLLALALWGAYTGWRQSLMVGPILLFIVAFVAAHLPIIGAARYQVPLIPLLAILACIPLRAVIGDVKRH